MQLCPKNRWKIRCHIFSCFHCHLTYFFFFQKQLIHNKFLKLLLLNLVSSGLRMCPINSSVESKLDDESFVTVIQWFVVMSGNTKSDVNWLKLQ